MTRTLLFRLLLGVCALLCAGGCAERDTPREASSGHSFSVENHGSIVIYVSVSGDRFGRIDVAVLVPGARATEGFGPFCIGGTISVLWGEGEGHTTRDRTAMFDTKPFIAVADKMTEFRLVFHGDAKWAMHALDAQRNELLVIEPSADK